MVKSVWKSLKNWLQMGVLAGGLLLPKIASCSEDWLETGYISWTSGIGSSIITLLHAEGAQETGYDGWDDTWSNAPPNPNNKWLKVYTAPYSEQLYADGRSP